MIGKKTNNLLTGIAKLIFWIHVFSVFYVIIGAFYRYPGIFWELHFWISVVIGIGVLIDECPLTTFERWIRTKAGQKNIANRGSRFLEVFYKRTGIRLPNSLMRILGLIYFVLGVGVHFIK